jgi:hypothetical protein
MIGQILSSVTGLATSWLDSKAQQKLLETEIKKKRMNYVLLITQQFL